MDFGTSYTDILNFTLAVYCQMYTGDAFMYVTAKAAEVLSRQMAGGSLSALKLHKSYLNEFLNQMQY